MDNSKSAFIELIKSQRVIPLYYHADAEVSIEVLKALYRAGIRAVEYTNRGAAALQNFKEMRRVSDKELEGMRLGIGTIKNEKAAEEYIAAGADFIICPGLVEEVIAISEKHNKLCIPGCMTPSEIIRAENLGIQMVKLFPGNMLGPSFLKSIKSLFPDMLFMPTGGVDVTEESITSWFDAGVCAVGMGSNLISKKLLEQKDYRGIEEQVRKAIRLVKQVNG